MRQDEKKGFAYEKQEDTRKDSGIKYFLKASYVPATLGLVHFIGEQH